MDIKTNRDFASFLDEPAVRAAPYQDYEENEGDADEGFATAPTIPFDYLSVADELHSGRIQVEPDRRKARNSEAYRAEFEAYLDAAKPFIASPPLADALLPSTDPDEIAAELGLDTADAADFTRIRRRFAFANHPDRVEPHLRERAIVRMQLANMMIDAAQSRVAVSGR